MSTINVYTGNGILVARTLVSFVCSVLRLFEVLLGIDREFDHAFEEMIRGKPGEVVVDQLLDIQAADVPQFERAAAR